MLQALARKGALELLLEDGARPVFRFDQGDKPVSQTVLQRAQIIRLMSELADSNQASRIAGGAPVQFAYKTPDGACFECRVGSEDGPFGARLVPSSNVGAGAVTSPGTPVEPESIPAPDFQHTTSSPQPTATGPRDGAPEIEQLLTYLVETGASDLHLCAEQVPMARLHGDMIEVPGRQPCSPEETARLLFAIIPPRNKKEFEETNDTDFAYEIPGVARYRANIFMDRKGIGGVFRVIPSDILTAEKLGLSKPILDLCHLSKGLVLVTGPTGSGKSTTLAAMIDYVNQVRTDHIITIEDPIEFVHPNKKCLVNQREVHTHTQGFKEALRAALREDPDIILVGEMRDLETIAIAIETAETGHLVFGTLHTTTAPSTVDRIIDQFPADRQWQIRTMLAESLKGVVSQTLLKKTGGGRIAALEVLIGVTAISNLIREGKTFQIPSIMQTGKKHGMVLLNDALMALVKKKLVDPAEAYRKAIDKAGFTSQLRSAGLKVPDFTD